MEKQPGKLGKTSLKDEKNSREKKLENQPGNFSRFCEDEGYMKLYKM